MRGRTRAIGSRLLKLLNGSRALARRERRAKTRKRRFFERWRLILAVVASIGANCGPSAATDEGRPPLPPKRPSAASTPSATESEPAPAATPSPPPTATNQPPAADDCRAGLAARGVILKPVEQASPADPRCVMAAPVQLLSLPLPSGGRLDLPDHPTLDCPAAATFADYVDELLAPLAKAYFDATLIAIATGPGFDCRTRNHIADSKLSAHAKGLAIDIAALRFAGGRLYEVGRLADAPERAFDRAARAAACGYFHTALGPGADAFHSAHWHFDLETRGADGKAKFCQ
ncbi:extensin family protein [Methylocella silvestris]|nr:extensin family protein [Methylocella silvestris]